MTIDELIEEAARLGRWSLVGRYIRRGRGHVEECPITAVANAREPDCFYIQEEWPTAADILGLNDDSSFSIIQAADNEGASDIRHRMLKAFGLTPTPARVDAGSVKEQH